MVASEANAGMECADQDMPSPVLAMLEPRARRRALGTWNFWEASIIHISSRGDNGAASACEKAAR